MQHAIIFAHPKQESFTASVAAAYAKACTTLGHQTLVRDLYRMRFSPCLEERELPWSADFAPGADVLAERKLLAQADVFALVYPFWLNAPPAILKGYLDRVFGFGFAYGKDGRSSPLLQGRSLITLSSSGAPLEWVQQSGAMDAIGRLFDRYFAELCGLTFLDHVHFGGIVPEIRQDAVAMRLAHVEETVKKHFGTLRSLEEIKMVQLIVAPDFWVSRIYPEGTIEQWLVQDGSDVDAGQPVANLKIEGELITLKAPAKGRLVIEARNNGLIEPGSVIGHIAQASAA